MSPDRDPRFQRAHRAADRVTALRVAVRLQEQEQEVVRAAYDTMRELVVACDPNGRINVINQAMAAFAGLEPSDPPPDSWAAYGDLFELDGTPLGADQWPTARALRGETAQSVEILMETRSGGRRSLIVDGRRLTSRDGGHLGAVVLLRDVTDQRAAEAALAFREVHDSLTGLPNRVLFGNRIRLALGRGRLDRWSTAVLAINLDRFAETARRLGGGAGQQLLSEVAQRLVLMFPSLDSLSNPTDVLAHLGGDQFLLLCENVADADAAQLVAHRVNVALQAPMAIAGEAVSVTAGIGIALTRDPEHDPEALILEAEMAMRRAKRRGAGRQERFAPEMRAQLHARIESEEELRRALARGEFRLEYQPKVSLMTDRMTGVEALLRWDHPERGVVPPLDFIRLAEESGLIVPIGCWVLDQACRQAQRWSKSLSGGLPLAVSVNLSPRQFDPGLAQTFGAIIAGAGIDPATVCLEVTEGMVMEDAEFAIRTLDELKSLGLSISMDDFGTGFSSLSYLKRFPLDELKIDKSFIDGLGRDPEATAIVAAVMGMAHALGLRVVAEGVETADQLARLRTLGCDEVQGYLHARPGSAGDIDAMLLAEAAAKARRPLQPDVRGIDTSPAERVLVVDDTADVRQLARSSLAAVGFEVREAGSGEEAITLTRYFRPDCVILDVNLPGISGFDVCRILRDDPQHQHTTIVMLTVDREPAEKVEAFSLKADDYMVKPFSPRDLVSRVTSAMRRRAETLAEVPK